MSIAFLTESAKDFAETATIGGFTSGNKKNDFDSIFTEAYNNMLANGTDVMIDVNDLKNKIKFILLYLRALELKMVSF